MSFKKKVNIYILKTNCTPKKLDDVVIIANYYIIYIMHIIPVDVLLQNISQCIQGEKWIIT